MALHHTLLVVAFLSLGFCYILKGPRKVHSLKLHHILVFILKTRVTIGHEPSGVHTGHLSPLVLADAS